MHVKINQSPLTTAPCDKQNLNRTTLNYRILHTMFGFHFDTFCSWEETTSPLSSCKTVFLVELASVIKSIFTFRFTAIYWCANKTSNGWCWKIMAKKLHPNYKEKIWIIMVKVKQKQNIFVLNAAEWITYNFHEHVAAK